MSQLIKLLCLLQSLSVWLLNFLLWYNIFDLATGTGAVVYSGIKPGRTSADSSVAQHVRHCGWVTSPFRSGLTKPSSHTHSAVLRICRPSQTSCKRCGGSVFYIAYNAYMKLIPFQSTPPSRLTSPVMAPIAASGRRCRVSGHIVFKTLSDNIAPTSPRAQLTSPILSPSAPLSPPTKSEPCVMSPPTLPNSNYSHIQARRLRSSSVRKTPRSRASSLTSG